MRTPFQTAAEAARAARGRSSLPFPRSSLAPSLRPSAAVPAPRGHVSATSAPLRSAPPEPAAAERAGGGRSGRLPPLGSCSPSAARPGPGHSAAPAREDAAVAGGQFLRAAGGAASLRLVLRPAGAGLPALPGVRRRGLLLGGAALRGPAAPGAGQAEAALPGGARLPLGAAAGAVPDAGAGGQQLRCLGAQQRLGQLELGLHLLSLLRQHRPLHHG